jgi:hypothetical protein
MKDGRTNLIQSQSTLPEMGVVKERLSRVLTGSLDIKSELERDSVELECLSREQGAQCTRAIYTRATQCGLCFPGASGTLHEKYDE